MWVLAHTETKTFNEHAPMKKKYTCWSAFFYEEKNNLSYRDRKENIFKKWMVKRTEIIIAKWAICSWNRKRKFFSNLSTNSIVDIRKLRKKVNLLFSTEHFRYSKLSLGERRDEKTKQRKIFQINELQKIFQQLPCRRCWARGHYQKV